MITPSHNRMNKNQESDPVDFLIRQAQPEMSRMECAAELGFDARLRMALGQQTASIYFAWEDAAKRSLKIAGALTAVIVVQFGLWVAASIGDGLPQSNLTIEWLLLGI